jgi:hypothetical protein
MKLVYILKQKSARVVVRAAVNIKKEINENSKKNNIFVLKIPI